MEHCFFLGQVIPNRYTFDKLITSNGSIINRWGVFTTSQGAYSRDILCYMSVYVLPTTSFIFRDPFSITGEFNMIVLKKMYFNWTFLYVARSVFDKLNAVTLVRIFLITFRFFWSKCIFRPPNHVYSHFQSFLVGSYLRYFYFDILSWCAKHFLKSIASQFLVNRLLCCLMGRRGWGN